MRTCLQCGKPIREGADFCTACGAPAPAAPPEQNAGRQTNPGPSAQQAASGAAGGVYTDVPLITLAPERTPMSKQRLLHTGKLFLGVVAVILLALGAIFASAYLKTDPFKENPFVESSLSGESYNKCRALVADVRNDNFDLIIQDIIQMEGDFENYNFLSVYEQLFKEIVPDDSSDPTAILFRNCCFEIAYTEFMAKKYESYASSGLLASLYIDDADRYRTHADELWNRLNNAQTEEHLQFIIDYCAENDIIHLKDAPSSQAEKPEEEAGVQESFEDTLQDVIEGLTQ